jgi:acyl carrier protein
LEGSVVTQAEKIRMLEEVMGLEEGVITPSTELSGLAEWDSIAVISFIVLMDEHFGKQISGAQIRGFVTVADALSAMA